MKPRVLFLSGDLGLGGAAIFVLNICDGLRELGHWEGVAAVFYQKGDVGEQIEQAGHRLIGPIDEALIQEEYIEGLFEQCAIHRPSVVVANLGAETFDFLRYLPEGVLRVGLVHSDQECVYRVVETYARWLDLVVCVSQKTAEEIRRRPALKDVMVSSIACGVPIPSRVRTAGSKRLRVLYLGRIAEEQKRASWLGRIIRTSLERCNDIEWTIIGDGPDLPSLQDGLKGFDERVSFMGPVSYDRVPDLVVNHDVYFLCSDYEGLPLSLLEAMGAGLVPVVSDLPSGISEVVNSGNGIKINPSDEESYVEALIGLADDRLLLEQLSKAARKEVETRFSTVAMAQRWENQLSMVAGNQATVEWTMRDTATVPLIAGDAWYFHRRLRFLRRALKRLRQMKG
jgi:glycosyltransferase involved in cell wall biosynthesis